MKKLFLILVITMTSFASMANEHIVYSSSALIVADNDACVGVAVEAVVEYIMNKMEDPSDLDVLVVTNVTTLKRSSNYVIQAGMNEGTTQNFSVSVKCSGSVKR